MSFTNPAVPADSSDMLGIAPGFQYGMMTEQYGNVFKVVVDSTASTPAAQGKLLYWNGTTWQQAATANLAVPRGMYGVVVVPASAQGGNCVIQTQGYCANVSIKTGASVAAAATGDVPLAITTTGDLTPTAAATVPGVTWGICAQALAVSQSATLIAAFIGGF